jgi:hypothetical protein
VRSIRAERREINDIVMSPEFDKDRLCGDIPNAGRIVKRCRDDARAPWAEGRSTDSVPFGLELADGLASFLRSRCERSRPLGRDDARAIGLNAAE